MCSVKNMNPRGETCYFQDRSKKNNNKNIPHPYNLYGNMIRVRYAWQGKQHVSNKTAEKLLADKL